MHTDSSHERRRRLRGAWIVAIAVLLATGGCEYLGLDQSGSSGGSQADEEKKKKESAADESDESGSESEEEGGEESADESSDDQPEPEPPPLDKPASDDEDDRNRRQNPFAATPELEAGSDETDEEEAPERSGPLQRYSYEKYRLAGLISEVAVPKAMFIAPDRVGHVLKKGDRLGKEGGVIQDIRENEVELELPPEGEEGRSRAVTVELRQAEMPSQQQQQEGLTDEEKQTLQRLLRSEEGREAVRQEYKGQAQGGGGRGGGGGGGFQGLEPPED